MSGLDHIDANQRPGDGPHGEDDTMTEDMAAPPQDDAEADADMWALATAGDDDGDKTPTPEQPAEGSDETDAGDRAPADEAEPSDQDDEQDDGPPAADDEDPLAALAAERDARRKLEADTKAAKGRAASAQRELAEARRRLAELERQPAAPYDADRLKQQLDATREEFPEIGETLSSAFQAMNGRMDAMQRAEQARQQVAVLQETARLESAIPDYREIIQSNADAYMAWVDDQPRAIREAAARNSNYIVDAAEAAAVVSAFRDHITGGKAAPSGAPGARSAIETRRQRQIAAAASPRTAPRPARPPSEGSEDPDAIWKDMQRKGLF